jgi:uncharacterized phage protein (TIGR02218 family)
MMSYNDFEVSTQDGRAAALYLFEWGATKWRYTSADRAITVPELVDNVFVNVTYEPRAMKDNGMRQGSSSQNDFQIDGPADLPLVRLFRGSAPTESIWLTVRRLHYDDPEQATPIYWKGTVWNVKRPSQARSMIIGKPLTASLKRTGLRLCWTRECPHFLYDTACRVNPDDYAVVGAVVGLTANTISVVITESQEDGWFRGGFLSWKASEEGTIERRMIESDILDAESGETALTIIGLVDFLAVGDNVTLYPGCDRLPVTCDAKFHNIANYGGFDKMPGVSPFVGAIW